LEAEAKACNTAAVIILDHRQPGPGRLARFVYEYNVERGMIGLPHGIGVSRLSPVEQVELLSIGCGSLVARVTSAGSSFLMMV
jgi:hypothetical protein